VRGAILWALFRRELHLIWGIRHLFTAHPHRATTTTLTGEFWPIDVSCDCGRTFWPITRKGT